MRAAHRWNRPGVLVLRLLALILNRTRCYGCLPREAIQSTIATPIGVERQRAVNVLVQVNVRVCRLLSLVIPHVQSVNSNQI